jgi:hypothetical protein
MQWLANGRCRTQAIQPESSFMMNARESLLFDNSKEKGREEQLSDRLEQASFVLNAIGFAGLMLQTWSSLFDVFVVAAASGCAQPEQALIGLRCLTGFLSICLAVFFSDYYLREARASWIHSFVAHPVMRLFAALGMGCFFFATSFNRARLFMTEGLALLYASIMGSANVARYGLYCREQAIESATDRRPRQVSFRAHAARAVRENSVLSTTEEKRSKSAVIPMSQRPAPRAKAVSAAV